MVFDKNGKCSWLTYQKLISHIRFDGGQGSITWQGSEVQALGWVWYEICACSLVVKYLTFNQDTVGSSPIKHTIMRYGVMAAHQTLTLIVQVQILLPQPSKSIDNVLQRFWQTGKTVWRLGKTSNKGVCRNWQTVQTQNLSQKCVWVQIPLHLLQIG